MSAVKHWTTYVFILLELIFMVSGVVLSVGGYYSRIDLFNDRPLGEIYRSSPDFTSKSGNWSENWVLVDDLALLRGNKLSVSVYAGNTRHMYSYIDRFNVGLTIYFVEISRPGERPDEGSILDLERLSYNFSGTLRDDGSPFWTANKDTYFPYDKKCRVYWFVEVSTTYQGGVIIQFDIALKVTRSSDVAPNLNTLVLGLVLLSASFMLMHRSPARKDSDDTVLWSKEPK